MDFKVFNINDFVKEEFEMKCVVQLKNGHYYEAKLMKCGDGKMIVGTYSREYRRYKSIELKKIKYYATID